MSGPKRAGFIFFYSEEVAEKFISYIAPRLANAATALSTFVNSPTIATKNFFIFNTAVTQSYYIPESLGSDDINQSFGDGGLFHPNSLWQPYRVFDIPATGEGTEKSGETPIANFISASPLAAGANYNTQVPDNTLLYLLYKKTLPSRVGFLFVNSLTIANSLHGILQAAPFGEVVGTGGSVFVINDAAAPYNNFFVYSSAAQAGYNMIGNRNLFSPTTTWKPFKAYNISSNNSIAVDVSSSSSSVQTFLSSPALTEYTDYTHQVPNTSYLYMLYNPNSTQVPACFLAGAMVETDQGHLAIETVNPGINTIGGKRIVAITQESSPSARMVMLPKDVIEKGVPSKDTEITVWHQVYVKGRFIDASMVPGLKYRPYKGEILYNVLMDNHEIIKINNITTKSLPPNHMLAVRYFS